MTTNCTVDSKLAPWVVAAVTQQSLVCFLGAVGNTISIWCLVRCDRTKLPVKIQLVCAFSMILASCVLTQPLVTWIYYLDFFCLPNGIPSQVKFILSIFNSMVMQMERMIFAAIAVFRLIAVCWPVLYQRWLTVPIVTSVMVLLCLCVLSPWVILGALQDFELPPNSGNVMKLELGDPDSLIFKFNTAIYVCLYLLPFLITCLAYLVMVAILVRLKGLAGSHNEASKDQVVFTVRLVILVNLLLDAPHVVVHFLKNVHFGSIICHMLFFLHRILDPLIFISMNKHYRRAVLRKLQSCLPGEWNLVATASGDKYLQDSVELRGTYHHTEVRNSRNSRKTFRLSKHRPTTMTPAGSTPFIPAEKRRSAH